MKPLLFVILDGFGIAPPSEGNAITQAYLPNYNNLIRYFPHAIITASGESVGLPWQNMGNSEVGHMNLGSGRVIYQNLPLINKKISDNTFYENKAFLRAIGHVQKNNSSLHLMGLTSTGGIHSHIKHLTALIELASLHKIKKVYIHFIPDGRDVPPKSATVFLKMVNQTIKKYRTGKIATVCGRLYALDRNDNWDRTKLAYDAMVNSKGPTFSSPEDVLKTTYKSNKIDEEITPSIITKLGKPIGKIEDNDSVIFYDYRPDRPKQLTKSIILPGFNNFDRGTRRKNILFVTFTQYDKDLPVQIAFPKVAINNSLGEIVANNDLRQFRIAETEKYAHVTMFFNCARIDPFKKEDRLIIPSPPVKSYDEAPEMSANKVTDTLITVMNNNMHELFLVNYANPDMIGHTGNIKQCVKGLQKVDECIGRIVTKIFELGGTCIITSDHGNCDEMINFQTNEINKEHTTNPVPLIIASKEHQRKSPLPDSQTDLSKLEPIGVLGDVAPTILDILGLKTPSDMTGISLNNMI